jgi:ribosomal protein S12 methylthiotransferase
VLGPSTSTEHEFVMQGRHAGQAPEVDGVVFLSGGEVRAGEVVRATVTQAADYDLVAEVAGSFDPDAARAAPIRAPRRVGLRVVKA